MLLTRLYYSAKPWLPQPLRLALRRWHARRILKSCGDTWPILESAARKPDGWRGWPDGKQFALVLTHDVESQRGLDNVKPLAELEMSLGFRSSFNFIPEGPYTVPPALRAWLLDHGFEVGVHDLYHDGKLYRSREAFRQHARTINQYLEDWNAVGFRSAFMLRQLDWLHDLNIQYDSSTFDTDPFEPQPDGAGTIFPFWVAGKKDRGEGVVDRGASPYPLSYMPSPPPEREDREERIADRGTPPLTPYPLSPIPYSNHSGEAPRGYLELPYTLPQDSTLFLLLRESSPAIWLRKLDWIAKSGGMALLDTHPDYMAFDDTCTSRSFPVRFYGDFLSRLHAQYREEMWCGSPAEVARHVRSSTRQNREADDAQKLQNDHDSESSHLSQLSRKRAAVLLFSYYARDPRPRRAAEALAQQGMTVDVICLRDNASEPASEQLNGVNIRRVPLKRHRGGKAAYLLQYFSFISICFVLLTIRSLRRRYHLVHVHNMPDVLVFSALIPKLLGAKIILDLHDPMPELMMTIFNLDARSRSVAQLKRFERWSIALADSVLTVNQCCKRIFGTRSCRPEKVRVIMNTPDERLFRLTTPDTQSARVPNRAKPFKLMYHGSLVERHGLDVAVEALEVARKSIPTAELRVYGARTPFLDQVMESVKVRGLHEVVHYHGPKRIEEIAEAIRACDLGIIPNRRNIFTEINTPTRIFEYIICGKPVIAPSAPGIRDYFTERDLLFFELGNAEDLARQIEFAFSHPEEVHDIIGRGQQIYLKHRWSEERLNLVDHVGHMLNGHSEPRGT